MKYTQATGSHEFIRIGRTSDLGPHFNKFSSFLREIRLTGRWRRPLLIEKKKEKSPAEGLLLDSIDP